MNRCCKAKKAWKVSIRLIQERKSLCCCQDKKNSRKETKGSHCTSQTKPTLTCRQCAVRATTNRPWWTEQSKNFWRRTGRQQATSKKIAPTSSAEVGAFLFLEGKSLAKHRMHDRRLLAADSRHAHIDKNRQTWKKKYFFESLAKNRSVCA